MADSLTIQFVAHLFMVFIYLWFLLLIKLANKYSQYENRQSTYLMDFL